MRKFTPVFLLIFSLCLIQTAFCYTVVLKNGKTKEGTLLSENDEAYVLQDSEGIRMTFKKATVDVAKTIQQNSVDSTATVKDPKESAPSTPAEPATPANDVKAAVTTKTPDTVKSATPEKPVDAPKPADVKTDKSKKGKTLKEEDLEELRKKYDFGTSDNPDADPAVDQQEPPASDDNVERSEADWKNSSDQFRGRVEQAQNVYNALNQQCQNFQQATVQSDVIVNSKTGEVLPLQETAQRACEQAEQARAIAEKANEEYQNFLSEAKHENVPPGWIRNPDGSDPEL
jgi:hypothetical protein